MVSRAAMRVSGFDLNLLAAFEALMETRSVTGAATRLGVGQPAMSAALARLRAGLGDDLFVRSADGMRPTARALEIAPGLAATLAGLRRTLEDGAAFRPATTARRFVIAGTDHAAAVMLPGIAARMREEAPGADLHVLGYEKGDVPALLDRGGADLAFGVFPEPPERSVVVPLFGDRFVGVARAGHPALKGGAVGLDAFLAWPHALVTVRRDATGAVDAALAVLGRERRVAAALPHMLALVPLVASTDLLAAVPERLLGWVEAAGVRRFDLPVEIAPWTVAMLWPVAARGDRGGAWLRGLVREVAAGLAVRSGSAPARTARARPAPRR